MHTSRFSVPRTDPRIRVGLPVRLRFGWKESEETRASIIDVSERGLRVCCHAPLRMGMEVKAIFEDSPDDAKLYTVVWVRDSESPEHAFDIGLELKV
ncbi:MAG: PilZ domain-containing protein [Acidobacteriia bacterium]|nr:PilZ domain-containing protein [Terriglobia bacterium]